MAYAASIKRSVTIAGHETSISLEPVFWTALEAAAATEALPLNALIARIDVERLDSAPPPNLDVGDPPVADGAGDRVVMTATDPSPTGHGISRKSMVIAAFSTIVEWYDFTLYLYFATVLSRVFFGGGEARCSSTLGGFAVAYLMRPVGAIVFGHIGDRHGRRPMLLLSMALMSLAMLATALLPTHAQIGPLAGWLLIAAALRDGLLGRRRIYRGGRLSARRRAGRPARADRLAGRRRRARSAPCSRSACRR